MKNASSDGLFTELKTGSDTAFKKVYMENRTLFLNFGRKYKLSDDEILDIYQDAYIVLFENIVNGKLVELKSSVSTYLISIGKYKILEQLRKSRRRTSDENIMTSLTQDDEIIKSFEINSEKLSENQKILQVCFEKLGDKCKSILTMFYSKKFNIRKIMKEGGYNSENVVKSQKSRCLKSLKEMCINFKKSK